MKPGTKSDWWGIGGHDAAALFGANPYKSPLQVWGEKTGRIEKPDLSQNKAVQRGARRWSCRCCASTGRSPGGPVELD